MGHTPEAPPDQDIAIADHVGAGIDVADDQDAFFTMQDLARAQVAPINKVRAKLFIRFCRMGNDLMLNVTAL